MRLLKKISVTVITVMCLVSQLRAVPANPFWQQVTQSNGDVVTISGHGDEFFNWAEDTEGYVAAYDDNTGNWCYAYISGDKIQPSSTVLGSTDDKNQNKMRQSPLNKIKANDLGSLIGKADTLRNAKVVSNSAGRNTLRRDVSANSTQLSNMNPSLLVILLEYSDIQIVKSMDYWHGHFFGNDLYQLNDYFDEVSNGRFQYKGLERNGRNITTYPSGVSNVEFYDNGLVKVRLSKSHPKYQSSQTTNYNNIENDLKTAFNAVKSCFNFTPFANNLNDGCINSSDLAVYSVIAGWEASNSSNSSRQQRVWAHARSWIINNTIISIDYQYGLQLYSHAVQGEIYSGSLTDPTVMGIGVTAHELGHTLGLPDLYDTSPNRTRAVGPYSLMANGSWGAGRYEEGSQRPTHLDAWSKVFLGFVEPITVDGIQDWKGNLNTISGEYNVLKVTNTASDRQQYFLLENRGVDGYDGGFYTYGIMPLNNNAGGVLIYHVDESVNDEYGRADNSNWQRRGVSVEPADGSTMLDYQAIFRNDFDYYNHFFSNTYYERVGYPYGGDYGGRNGTFNEFTPLTTPNTDFYNSNNGISFKPSGISVKINGTRSSSMEVEVGEGSNTPIVKPQEFDGQYGIMLKQNPVLDKAEILLNEKLKAQSAKLTVYDMVGNVVFSNGTASFSRSVLMDKASHVLTWDLRNNAGRIVANGTYLVVVEVKSQNGRIVNYSEKLGVRK